MRELEKSGKIFGFDVLDVVTPRSWCFQLSLKVLIRYLGVGTLVVIE